MKKLLLLSLLSLTSISWTMEQTEVTEEETTTAVQPYSLNDLPIELKFCIASYLRNSSDESSLKKFLPLISASHISKVWYQIIQDTSLFNDEEQKKMLCAIPTSQALMAIAQQLGKSSKESSRPPVFNTFKEKVDTSVKALQDFRVHLNKQLEKKQKASAKGLAVKLNGQTVFEKFEILLNTSISPNICINDTGEITWSIICLPISQQIRFTKQPNKCLSFEREDDLWFCKDLQYFYYTIPIEKLNNFLKTLLEKNITTRSNKIKKNALITISPDVLAILIFANQTNDQELINLANAHGIKERTPMPWELFHDYPDGI